MGYAVLGEGEEEGWDAWENKMPGYVTTIKADAQRCEPDPCGGQRAAGRSAAVCETCALSL